MPGEYLEPDRYGQPRRGTADSNPHFEAAQGGDTLRAVFSRAGDNPRAARLTAGLLVRGDSGGVSMAASVLYEEPADPWTAYAWTDGTLIVTDAWVAAQTTPFVDPVDGLTKRLAPPMSRRQMTSGGRTIDLRHTSGIVVFRHSQFMGVAGDGTAKGIIGNGAGGVRAEFEDCSFYGPHLNLGNGQQPGPVRLEDFGRLHVRNCNFIKTGGLRPASLRASATAGDTFIAERNHFVDTWGRRRDTTSPDGWAQGENFPADHDRSNHVQLSNSAGVAGVLVAWNRGDQTPFASDIEDCFNMTNVQGTVGSPAVMRRNLANGAYPWRQGWDFAGGGVLIDANCQYVTTERNVVLNTTGYGVGMAGGSDVTLDGDRAFNVGQIGGVPVEASPDEGAYSREYYGGPHANRQMKNLVLGWGAPTAGNPARRQDGGSPAVGFGTATNITRFNNGVGAITQAIIDAERVQWLADAAAAGQTIGRRKPGQAGASA